MTFHIVRGHCARWAAISLLAIVGGGVGALLMSGCGGDRPRASATTRTVAARPPPDPATMRIGKRVFGEICHSCHTLLGKPHPPMTSGEPAGPDLDEVVVKRPYVEERVSSGGIAMASWQQALSKREFAAVVTYVTTLAGRNVGPDEDDATELTAGEQVFVAHCNVCHSIADRPRTGNPELPGADFTKVKPSEAFVRRIVTRRYGFMEAFRGKLTAAEVRSVAKFVQANAGS